MKNKDQGNFFSSEKNNLMKKYKRTIMIKFSNLRLTTLLGYKTSHSFASLRNNKSETAIVTFSNDELKKNKTGFFPRVRWVPVLFSLHRSFPNMFASLQNQKRFVSDNIFIYSTICNYILYLKQMNF